MRRLAPPAIAVAALAALALGLAGCGGDDDSSDPEPAPPATTAPATTAADTTPTAPAAGGSTLAVDADPSGSLAFTQTTLTTSAGEVTITLRNESSVPHNIAVRGGSVDSEPSETITGGDTADLMVDLATGEYEYYCEVPGHADAGMVGTLTVE